jgi:DNA-binding NtrC family response regulator
LTQEAQKVIAEYPWKGNVRQLRNFCERLVIIAVKSEIDKKFIELQIENVYGICMTSNVKSHSLEENLYELSFVTDDAEEKVIKKLLDKYQGNRTSVAKELNISLSTLWRKIQKYHIVSKYI